MGKKRTKRTSAPKPAASSGVSAKREATVAAEPVHVLIRVKSEGGQTFKEHGRIIAAKGAALLGKMGQRIGPAFVNELNEQIEAGVATFLFLTTREGWNGPYVTYRCKLRQIHDSLPPEKRSFVPTYYAQSYHLIGTWFEILTMEKLAREEMNRIYVLSSGREIMSVVQSSAVIFRVGVR